MFANQATYPEAVAAAFAAYDAACKQLVGLDFTQLTPAVLLDVQSRREHAARITANVDHRILAALQAQTTPKEIGARTWAEVLMIRMQLSKTEANQRIAEAADLGPRCAIDGQPLEPVLPNTAQALADGAINRCHVDEIRSTVSKAAKYASAAKCAELEQILARAARSVTPLALRDIGNHALRLWNQDGDGPDLPAHKPGIHFGPQDADGLVEFHGYLDSELAGYLLLALKVWAAPGVNNPEDAEPLNEPDLSPLDDIDVPAPQPAEVTPPAEPAESPVDTQLSLADVMAQDAEHDPAPSDVRAQWNTAMDAPPPTPEEHERRQADAEQRWDEFNQASARPNVAPEERAQRLDDHDRAIGLKPQTPASRDTRCRSLRNHDALKVILRDLLMSKKLGQHNGLPVTLVVSTTLAELSAKAGLARTNVGTTMSIPDMIRLGAHAEHYLLVYREHTAQPLYLGRAKRLASKAQRLVMIARDNGCTKPGCPLPASECQGMHVDRDWVADGQTDITGLGLGCGPDNLLAFETGWKTSIGADGRVHWQPPPLLDVGQDTLNHAHHPEELLRPEQDDDDS